MSLCHLTSVGVTQQAKLLRTKDFHCVNLWCVRNGSTQPLGVGTGEPPQQGGSPRVCVTSSLYRADDTARPIKGNSLSLLELHCVIYIKTRKWGDTP